MFNLDKILNSKESYHKWRLERIKHVEKDFPEIFEVGGKKVLDVGCGAEAPLAHYLTEKKGADVYAGDISTDLVSSAKKFAKKAKLKVFPGERLPYDDKSFDISYLFDVLEHVKDPLKTMLELKRVTKDGGLIYIKYSPFYAYPTGPHLYSLGFPKGLLPFQFLPNRITKKVIFSTKKNLGQHTKDTPHFLYEEFLELNRISVAKFWKISKELNLKVVKHKMYISLPNSQVNVSFLSGVPFLREIFAMSYSVLLRR